MDHLADFFKHKYPQNENHINYIKSPLRICPLGAHVDHQYGLVTGMALDIGINMIYAPNQNGYIRVESLNFPTEECFHLSQIPSMIPSFWGNYLRGSVLALKRTNSLKYGIDAVVEGNYLIGGLSSSAAVTDAYLLALCDVNNILVSPVDMIHYSNWVENNFIGLNNGILDQAINILSRERYLTFMDTKTENYELIMKPESLPEFEVVLVFSGISKALIETDYNNRVDECKVSAWLLQELVGGPVTSLKETRLRDIDYALYQKYKFNLYGRFQKRAEHFFSENERVKKGVQAWKNGELYAFGQLMFLSGESSIQNYECGCPEIITIFDILKETPGVYGARFSGAGYRGWCIGLVNPVYKERIRDKITSEYLKKYPQHQDSYRICFCKTGDGARILKWAIEPM
jgi:galactokinase